MNKNKSKRGSFGKVGVPILVLIIVLIIGAGYITWRLFYSDRNVAQNIVAEETSTPESTATQVDEKSQDFSDDHENDYLYEFPEQGIAIIKDAVSTQFQTVPEDNPISGTVDVKFVLTARYDAVRDTCPSYHDTSLRIYNNNDYDGLGSAFSSSGGRFLSGPVVTQERVQQSIDNGEYVDNSNSYNPIKIKLKPVNNKIAFFYSYKMQESCKLFYDDNGSMIAPGPFDSLDSTNLPTYDDLLEGLVVLKSN